MGSKGTSCIGSSLWEELGRDNKFDQTVVGSSQQTKKCENLKIFFLGGGESLYVLSHGKLFWDLFLSLRVTAEPCFKGRLIIKKSCSQKA